MLAGARGAYQPGSFEIDDGPSGHCPLCARPNQCGVALGRNTCWCFSRPILDEVLAKIPPEAQEVTCVCEECAFGQREPSEVAKRLADLLRRRNGG